MVLIFSTPCAPRAHRSRARDRSAWRRSVRAEPARQRDEPLRVGEQHRSISECCRRSARRTAPSAARRRRRAGCCAAPPPSPPSARARRDGRRSRTGRDDAERGDCGRYVKLRNDDRARPIAAPSPGGNRNQAATCRPKQSSDRRRRSARKRSAPKITNGAAAPTIRLSWMPESRPRTGDQREQRQRLATRR